MAGAPFAVIREALADRSAVGHVAIHGREYLVAVLARHSSLVMYTLRTAGEVRDVQSIDEGDFADVKVKPAEVNLAGQVLDNLEPVKTLSSFTDHYQDALKDMLAKKGAPEPSVTYAEALQALGALHPDIGELVRRLGGAQVRACGTIDWAASTPATGASSGSRPSSSRYRLSCSTACIMYSEQVGWKRQAEGSSGEVLMISIEYQVRATNNVFNLVYPFYLERSPA